MDDPSVDYPSLLTLGSGDILPSVKTLREHEGLFERFEVVDSKAVLYFPSSVVLDSMGQMTLHDDGVFFAYVLIEGFKDGGGERRCDPFYISNANEQFGFSIVRKNKSNKGISKVKRANANIMDRVARRTSELKSKKRRQQAQEDVFWVTMDDSPYKVYDIQKGSTHVNVFYNEKSATYGFSGLSICSLHFGDMRSPS
jgi:hypothetical protein